MNNEERKLFWETLCSLDGEDIEDDFQQIKTKILYPKFLYRYRPISDNNIDALKNNKLYFSRSSYYDDPFDTYLHIDYKNIYQQLINTEDRKKSAVEMFRQICLEKGMDKKVIENLIKEINSTSTEQLFNVLVSFMKNEIQPIIRNTSMSICFSESGLNETMWLKYANQYKGFCLMYSLDDDEKFLCGKQEKCKYCGVHLYGTPLYPLYYSEIRYDATKYAYNLTHEYFLRNIYPDMSEKEILSRLEPCIWEKEKVTLIKSKCHEYDAEWRMILSRQMKEPVMREWIPYGVILGLKIGDNERSIVIDSAKHAGIKHIFQSVINNNGGLDMIEITEEINNA